MTVIGDSMQWIYQALPHGHAPVTGAVTAVTGAAIWTAWRLSNPHRRDAAPDAALTVTGPAAPTLMNTVGKNTGFGPVDDTPGYIGPQGRSAYDTLGKDAIRAVVDQFYGLVLADESLAPYFATVDMERLRRHQALLIGQLYGGPVEYELQALAHAHQHLHISVDAYWRVVGHLMTVLDRLGAPEWIVTHTFRVVRDAEKLIVNDDLTDGGTSR